MSELASVEKLREWLHEDAYEHPELMAIVDEIDREVAKRFILLPVDMDGVPWHIGDMTENRNIVNGITFDRHGAHFTSTLNDINPSIHTHVKPRTIEDVLRDFLDVKVYTSKTYERYADEIRGMIEADE